MLILIRLIRAALERRKASAAPDSQAADGKSAASRGPLALLVHQARFDLLASFRNPRARFFTLVFPVLLLVIFGGVFGHGTTTVDGVKVGIERFFVPGIITISVVTAAYAGIAISVAGARESGVLKRRRATPVPPLVLLGGQALATLATACAMTALLLVIARLGYGVGISAGALAATAIAVILGTLAFASLGYAVAGLVGNPDAAQPITQATLMPLYFISGVWIPNDQLPSALRAIARIFPVEHLAAALHLASVRTSLSAALAPRDLAVLALWAVGGAALAVRRFSWMPSAAGA